MVQETYYEIVVMVDGKPHAVKVNAAGAMMGEEENGAKKEKDEDDKD